MHQTIYIDIDEEITSIVERLKKAQANEVIIVVPKRALLIQSIVNLRLLKKEADNLGMQLMIVTQDKLGKLLVEKAGILVQQKLDDLEEEELVVPRRKGAAPSLAPEIQTQDNHIKTSAKNRLDNLGTESYFSKSQEGKRVEARTPIKVKNKSETEKIINKELVSNLGEEIKKSRKNSPIDLRSSNLPGKKGNYPRTGSFQEPRGNTQSDQKLENFFYSGARNVQESERVVSRKDRGGARKIFFILLILVILGGLGTAGFFFLPKAQIALTLKTKSQAIDADIKADVNFSSLDFSNEVIPAKIVTQEEEITQTFPVSGSKAGSNQKAKGTISIYNEFSTSSQPLVATTRFETQDGKIFRITKSVTVPGTTKVGEETKPGVIEAEVVADQPGEEYNIELTRFTIPGFKDNQDKYKKFYAVSSKAMTGGGKGGSSVKTLEESDISNAKSKIVPSLTEKVKEKIKSGKNSMVILDDAINLEEATYKTSDSVGEAVESFQLTAKVKANAIVFEESDLKSILVSKISKMEGSKVKLDGTSLSLEYGKSEADFKLGTLRIKVHAKSESSPDFNISEMKKNIAGKNNQDLEIFLNSLPDVEKAEVTYWPPFMSSRIPKYEKRIEITIESSR